jgi:hypothetical protein
MQHHTLLSLSLSAYCAAAPQGLDPSVLRATFQPREPPSTRGAGKAGSATPGQQGGGGSSDEEGGAEVAEVAAAVSAAVSKGVYKVRLYGSVTQIPSPCSHVCIDRFQASAWRWNFGIGWRAASICQQRHIDVILKMLGVPDP